MKPSAVLALCGAIVLIFFLILRLSPIDRRPLIREIAVESVRDMDGWVLIYRYAVDGDDSTVILRDDADLESYRAYLRRFGDIYPATK